jgi:hypothetical protein
MTAYVMFEKKNTKKNDIIVNIDKEKYEINSLLYIRVMISYVRKYSLCGFRKVNIASIFITLTEINNETHYVAKKIKNKKQNKKTPKKPSKNCSDRIRTLSVNLQGSRSSDYAITAMVQ